MFCAYKSTGFLKHIYPFSVTLMINLATLECQALIAMHCYMEDRMVGVGYSGDQILWLKFVYLILIVNDFVVFA